MNIDYKDYQKLILYLAAKWHKYMGIEKEEAVSIANYAYCRAIKNYNFNKQIKFNTYLTNTIIGHYKNYYNKEKETIEYKDIYEKEYGSDLNILKNNLSNDSKSIIDLILGESEEFKEKIFNNKSNGNNRKYKIEIRKYLKKYYNLDKNKVNLLFKEIEYNL